jgi:hypothetical protein
MDDLVAFTARMDRCWLERRFGGLPAFLAEDVVMVAPGGKQRMKGREAAIESYREFMDRSRVHRFDAHDHVVTSRDGAAVVEYGWTMEWESGGEARPSGGP